MACGSDEDEPNIVYMDFGLFARERPTADVIRAAFANGADEVVLNSLANFEVSDAASMANVRDALQRLIEAGNGRVRFSENSIINPSVAIHELLLNSPIPREYSVQFDKCWCAMETGICEELGIKN